MSDETEAELVAIEIARAKEQDAEISAWEDDFFRHRRADAMSDELYDADPNCKHEIVELWSGIKCQKCRGWFCY